jgi:SAM-dependent methyltransferase
MGLLPGKEAAFWDLHDSGALSDLFSDRLLSPLNTMEVSSEATSQEFAAIYRLEETPRITYWHEWSPKMLQAAALRLIDLLLKLAAREMILRNPHPWNLLYDGRHFSYANSGSIVRLNAETLARSCEKLLRFFIRPLVLMERGLSHTAQRLMADPRDGVLAEDLAATPPKWLAWNGSLDSGIPYLNRLAHDVASLGLRTAPDRWIEYFATDCDFTPGSSWHKKQEVLEAMLEDGSIHSVLDLGANTGHYARIAAKRGRTVIAADFDPSLVDAAFEESQASGLVVNPVVMDFSHPTPGQGVDCSWFPPATQRFQSDLVLCFALAHHMVFGKYRMDFDQVARGVRSFSRAWALVEYVERGKIRPSEWRPDSDRWYSLESFASALRRYFPAVEVLKPARDGRRLLVCGPHRRSL